MGIKIWKVMCVLSLIIGLFGCNKTSDYPFDVDKAYCYTRAGVIAGGNFYMEFDKENIVDYHSYTTPVPKYECGMKDKGAQIYFVGLKEGTVTVTAVFEYPTCEPEEYSFTLKVSDDLSVSLIDQ